MANMRVFPSAKAPTTVVVQGRTYTCAIGATPLLVPDFDAFVLMANGWLKSAGDGGGTTVLRPVASYGVAAPKVGFEYYDTDVGGNVIWNGTAWILHTTGAANP